MVNYETGNAYVALAKNIGTVVLMLENMMRKLDDDLLGVDDIFDDLLLVSYVSRVGIIELLEKYKWNPNGFIFVDPINSEAIPLTLALNESVEKVLQLGRQLNVDTYTVGIIEKKEMFYNYEQVLPKDFKKSLLE